MANARVEFTVEPFAAGDLGPHVRAAIEAACNVAGEGSVDVGPFASSALVASDDAPRIVHDIVQAALANGATRVAIHVEEDMS